MAKDSQFRAHDLHGKKSHFISSPPAKITRHRLNPGEWARTEPFPRKSGAKITKKRTAKTKKTPSKKAVRTAIDILRCWSAEIECLHCGKLGNDASCGSKCYEQFRKANSISHLIDIKGPGSLGYGAYTKPGAQVKKGQWLDEYLGELKPLSGETERQRLPLSL
ncbi:hypothetical protein LTR85_009235 [Meristemomyces frigidus]|nr:hypothetical protein LTR85_009235 [Meristemomyces frigidus]